MSRPVPSPFWAAIKRRINGYGEGMVRMMADLTAIPALGPANGGDGEQAKAHYLEGRLLELAPQRVVRVPCPDPRVSAKFRPNLIALFPGRTAERTVWVLSHLDTVPPGEPRLWKSDPYRLRRQGDFLFGRGVVDNHHGIVASFFAVKALREEGLQPPITVGLIFVSDEETGSSKGLQFLLRRKQALFRPSDLILVPDAGNADGTLIEVAEKSLLWVKFTLTGRSAHASRPDLGVNTLRAAARLIRELERLPRLFPGRDPRFDIPVSTFEPTQIEANVFNVNSIPGRDVFYLDCRVLPRYPLAGVLGTIGELASRVARETGTRIAVESINAVQAPPPTPAETPVVQALQDAIWKVYRKKASPRGIGGATVAAFFRARGLPAAVWMRSLETAHQPNEKGRLSHIIGDAQVMAHLFSRPVD
jgi:succinyl-diaminopimelate desuccinylase